jgi:hypothetical protein
MINVILGGTGNHMTEDGRTPFDEPEVDVTDCEYEDDSTCCGAPIINGICNQCKEHAEPKGE